MTSFVLEPWLVTQQRRVEGLLQSRLAVLNGSAPHRLTEAMSYSLLDGGKRLRPILCLAFADAARRQTVVDELSGDAACAVEFAHTYSLIHDDLPAMDDDDLRRGRPTNHKVYGEAMAILAGDALLTEAFACLSRGSTAPMVRLRLVSELAGAAGASGMVGGQVLDIAQDRPSELDYLVRLHRLKTGALIKAACRMGAIAAQVGEAAVDCAERYGAAVGLAFQIADDILDVTQSPAEMGKPTGADAAAGRPTFPAVLGLERARQLAQEQVSTALEAARQLEGDDGPLQALARYSIARQH